jgi:hypothetical protein
MYAEFSSIKGNELWLQRKRLFFPWYELTDGQLTYGKISYRGLLRRTAVVETASDTWLFEYDGFFTRTLKISSQGEVTGKLKLCLFSKASLSMNDGFGAEFFRDDIFPASFGWHTDRFGEIVKLKKNYFTFRSINLTLDPNAAKISIVPLLCFLGSHLIILRQRRKAGAH